jgi:hypothetical protein
MPSSEVTGAPLPTQSKTKKHPGTTLKPAEVKTAPKHAVEEIDAYIVIRDGLLGEAEKQPTSELLRRLSIANDFVEHCLAPPQSPYEAQSYPETDAARERERCETVKRRIAEFGKAGT